MKHRLLMVFALGCGTDTVDLDEPPQGECPPETCFEAQLAEYTIGPYGETEGLCLSVTLNNDEAMFVNSVTAYNDGAFHHSNWFWVPEDQWDLPDGHWPCRENGFSELMAALSGGVVFAQSTQVWEETQQFLPGVVLEIGPRARIIASAHLLNATGDTIETTMNVRLGLIAADEVITKLAPMRITYSDLDIPAQSDTEHHGTCELSGLYAPTGGRSYDMKLHYVLSHFHGLGSGFELTVAGGPNDGQVLFEQRDAFGHKLGITFAEPIDLTGSDGLNFSCFHSNPTDKTVGWGIGDQEMCVMLGFVDSTTMYDLTINNTTEMGQDGDVLTRTGDCNILAVPF